MKVCSIFSGIGGFELGLSQAGFKTVLMCEKDELARAVLKHHFPATPIRTDVCRIKRIPNCDLLAAGWPCQDLSQAGRMAGISGERSGLVTEVLGLIESKRTRPEFVLLENVAFALQLQGGRAIEYVTSNLSRLGYRWAYRILDSRYFGLAQRRRRIFILGSLNYDPASILFHGGTVENSRVDQEASRFGFYWTEGNTGLGWSPDSVPPLKGGSSLSIPSPPAVWDAESGDFFRPGISDAERMQGFPAGWTDIGPLRDNFSRARWRLVGNAVSVPVVRWIAESIKSHVNGVSKEINLHNPPITPKKKVHNAAYGDNGIIRCFVMNESPDDPIEGSLRNFTFAGHEPLSLRAASGFLSRIERSSLRTHPKFIPDLRQYVS